MKIGAAFALLMSSAILMTSAPASAFHGTAYVLDGAASLPGLPIGLWDATLAWSGGFGIGGGQFRLTIVDPGTGQNLVSTTIIGRESLPVVWTNAPGCPSIERVTPYMGVDSATNGATFKVTGVQDNCFGGPRGGQRYMAVEGTYSGIWAIEVSYNAPF